MWVRVSWYRRCLHALLDRSAADIIHFMWNQATKGHISTIEQSKQFEQGKINNDKTIGTFFIHVLFYADQISRGIGYFILPHIHNVGGHTLLTSGRLLSISPRKRIAWSTSGVTMFILLWNFWYWNKLSFASPWLACKYGETKGYEEEIFAEVKTIFPNDCGDRLRCSHCRWGWTSRPPFLKQHL